MDVDFACAQDLRSDACLERYVLRGGPPLERPIPLPTTHVRPTRSGAALAHAAVGRAVRILARALYVFPALIVAKLILWLVGSWYGDLITVAFVLLVVAFFAALALWLMLHAIVGPRSTRTRGAALAFAPPSARDAERIAGALPPATTARFVGTVDAGLTPGEPVVVEEWSERDGRLLRLVEGRSFVLRASDRAPAAVELAGAPILLGRPDEPASSAALVVASALAPSRPEPTWRSVLRQGDRVELAAEGAVAGLPIEHPGLRALVASSSASGPYRAGEGSTVLARSTPEAPVVLRLL